MYKKLGWKYNAKKCFCFVHIMVCLACFILISDTLMLMHLPVPDPGLSRVFHSSADGTQYVKET